MATILTPFETAAPDSRTSGNGSSPAVPVPEVMTITPDLAVEWMALNTRNRNVRYPQVAQLARDMKAGKWELNGETIKIAEDGTILDGQHRLSACIQAGTPFRTFVIRGLPVTAQDTIDTGAPRRMADQLALRGEPNANLLAAVTRWAWKWLHGVRTAGSTDQNPTHNEMLAFIDLEPRLREATTWAEAARKQQVPLKVTGTVWGMAWLLFHGADHLAAEVFLEKVLTGEDCGHGHPALAFRNRMLSAQAEQQRLSGHEQLGYLIMAWNAFKDDRTLAKLLPPRGGFTPKTFPEPK